MKWMIMLAALVIGASALGVDGSDNGNWEERFSHALELDSAGQPLAAKEAMREALASLPGSDNYLTGSQRTETLRHLGRLAKDLGELDEAASWLREAYSTAVSMPTPPVNLDSIVNLLCDVYDERQVPGAKIELLRSYLATRRRIDGGDTRLNISISERLAEAYREAGQMVLAENEYRQAAAAIVAELGEHTPELEPILRGLLRVQVEARQHEAALITVSRIGQLSSVSTQERAHLYRMRAQLLRKVGKTLEAEQAEAAAAELSGQ